MEGRLRRLAAIIALVGLLAACLPGQLHPAPAPLIGLQLAADGTPVVVIRLCEPQTVISLSVQTESREQGWKVESEAENLRPERLRLLELPAGWVRVESSLDGFRPGGTYVVNVAAFLIPDVQLVYFRLPDLEGLGDGAVWSYQADAGPLDAQAMSMADFEDRAGEACAAAERRR